MSRHRHRLGLAGMVLALGVVPAAIGCAAESAPSEAPTDRTSQAQWFGNNPVGTWTFTGFAGKCLDVGGYPTRNGTPAMIYTCNGTAAQKITVAPANDARTEYELRAHGRCLTTSATPVSGTPVTLAQCDGSRAQRFVAQSIGGLRFKAADAPSLFIPVSNRTGNNRTPLVLQGWSPVPPANTDDVQGWQLEQVDTTPYTIAALTPARGTVSFVGLGGKCLDIGGAPYPASRQAILYGCNGTIAQKFDIVPVAGTRSDVEIHAGGHCLEVIGTGLVTIGGLTTAAPTNGNALVIQPIVTDPYAPGANVMLTECGGRATQRFGIEVFDGGYIFPAGHPEVAIGVRGASTANARPIELQSRGSFAADMWSVVSVEGAGYAPVLPKALFGRATQTDHRGGINVTTTVPALTLQDQSRTETKLSFLWRQLGAGAFTEIVVSGSLPDVNQSRFVVAPFTKNNAYEVKVRAEGPNGVSESVPFTVDARTPRAPTNLVVTSLKPDEVTLQWKAPGKPRVDDFKLTWTQQGSASVTAPDTGTKRGDLHEDDLRLAQQLRLHVRGDGAQRALGRRRLLRVHRRRHAGGQLGRRRRRRRPDADRHLRGRRHALPGRLSPDALLLRERVHGEPNCPAGYHPTEFTFDLGCDTQTSSGSIDPNSSWCVQDSDDFWTCGACPYNYVVTGTDSNFSCDHYQYTHCHKP